MEFTSPVFGKCISIVPEVDCGDAQSGAGSRLNAPSFNLGSPDDPLREDIFFPSGARCKWYYFGFANSLERTDGRFATCGWR
jgi:hypothetical protein